MFALRNLVSKEVFKSLPWSWTSRDAVPADCLTDKGRRTAWLQSPKTDYHVYTLYEGMDPASRVTTGTSEQDSNPPVKLHGLAVDYDIPVYDEAVKDAVARMEIPPNWFERTLSGNCRLIWMFERPLPLPSFNFATYLTKHFKTLLPIGNIGGLDENALSPTRMFTNGGLWTKLAEKPVPWVRIQGWFVPISNKYEWGSMERGTKIPIEAVEARLKEIAPERFPRFIEWTSDFVVGAQGPTFWVDGSTSPKSAIVRENGLHTFSAHAHKSFFSWDEILGVEWVKAFEETRLGRAIDNIFFDGHNFFIKAPDGSWMDENQDRLINELVVRRGLTREVCKKKGRSFSEIEEAIAHIRNHARVRGAAPFAFFPTGPIDFNGSRYLNTHTKNVMKPAAEPQIWGEKGGFPWLSRFFDGFFDPPIQLDYFLSWLSRFYGSCHTRQPVNGQNVFIAGGVGVGKTFISRGVLGPMLGGYSECKEFLLGEDTFNSELFDHALWVVDDGNVANSDSIHRHFSEMVKRLAANRDLRSNEKFKKASMVGWRGRVVVTCNDDAESIRIIPRLDMSLREKIMLLKAARREWKFYAEAEQEAVLRKELPAFARFVLDYKTPAHCLHPDPRFGIRHYHEPTLVASANLTTGSFGDILDAWMREEFTIRNPNHDTWEGTAVALRSSIVSDPNMIDLMKPFTLEKLKRAMAGLANNTLFKIEIIPEGEVRVSYRIHRHTHYPKSK